MLYNKDPQPIYMKYNTGFGSSNLLYESKDYYFKIGNKVRTHVQINTTKNEIYVVDIYAKKDENDYKSFYYKLKDDNLYRSKTKLNIYLNKDDDWELCNVNKI